MTHETENDNQSLIEKLTGILLNLPWADLLGDGLKALRKAVQGRSYRGLYEVLEYESTLKLQDPEGNKATFRKREKVRYLQDNVIAHQDQAWGDGQILLNYRCTPGTPVDRYRSGYKTYILISRREVKDNGDVDEFNIEWDMRESFLRQAEQWETHVTHRTQRLKINVIFPRSRPPRNTVLIEGNQQRSHDLGDKTQALPDGRWRLSWETHRPRLYENYVLQWEW